MRPEDRAKEAVGRMPMFATREEKETVTLIVTTTIREAELALLNEIMARVGSVLAEDEP